MTSRTPPKKKSFSWRSQAFRGLLYQIFAVVAIGLAIWFLAHNTATNMRIRGIQSGFDFLTSAAGFDIGESLYPFDSGEPYWRAFLVGVTNTLRVAVVGEKRSAVLGTSSTSLRSVATMVATAVMPGRRLRSLLSTSSVAT